MRQIYITLLNISQQSLIVIRIANLFWGGADVYQPYSITLIQEKHQRVRSVTSIPSTATTIPTSPTISSSILGSKLLATYPSFQCKKNHRQQKPRPSWKKQLQLHILRLKNLTLLHLMAPLSHMFLYLWRSHLVNFKYAFSLRSIYS